MKTYQDIFCEVPDPRVQGRCLHKLSDILFIALCTVIANGEDCMDMVSFAHEKEDWLRQVIELTNGIPSDNTFRRVLQIVDPECLSKILGQDGQAFLSTYQDELISIDGKKIKGANPKSKGNKGLYILSAWVSSAGISIGQSIVEDKSNEITAIPELLDKLEIAGSTVSIDAIGCQTAIAEKIVSKGADYLLSVKHNQSNLHEEIKENFSFAKQVDHDEQWEYGHGRYETRSCSILSAEECLSPEILDKWKSAQTLIKVQSQRIVEDTTTTSSRYYISSHRTKTAMQYNAMVRKHWSIENHLHWHLDVTFAEDDSRITVKNAPINMNILRKIALQIVKRKDDNNSLKKRRFRASLNQDYLTQLILL